MDTKELALSLIKKWEGCRLEAYQDGGGVWTIGWGHTGENIKRGVIWSQEQADKVLYEAVSLLERWVGATLPPTLKPSQKAALISFIYNVGWRAFMTSTLRKLIIQGHIQAAASQFRRWRFDNGKEVKGLLNRRIDEEEMFKR